MRMLLAAVILLAQADEKPKTDFSKFTMAREFQWVAKTMTASPDGKYIWTDKGTVKVTDWSVINEGKFLKTLVFVEDGKTTVALGATESDGMILYSLPDWKNLNAGALGGSFVSCDIAKDRKTIAAVGPFQDAICVVTRWESSTPAREVYKGPAMMYVRFVDANRFVTVGKDGTVHLWEVGKDKPVVSAKACDGEPVCAVITPDRKWLFVAGGSAIRRFGTTDLKDDAVPVDKMPTKPALAVSPKSRVLAVYGDGPCSFYSPETLKLVSTPLGPDATVATVAFAPDESYAALGEAGERRMTMVLVADGTKTFEFQTLTPPVAIAVGPKGAWILQSNKTQTYAYAPPAKKK